MLRIEDCSKSFGNQVIFDHISLQIDTPGRYVICGKSGCGKSTLLNMIAGFEPVTSGSITTDAEVMTIFQNYELIDELSVYDNIFLERKEEEKDKPNYNEVIDSLLISEESKTLLKKIFNYTK